MSGTKSKKSKERRKAEVELYNADDICQYGCTYREHFDSLERVIKDFCGEDSELTMEQAYSWMFNFDEPTEIDNTEQTCFVQENNVVPPVKTITDKDGNPKEVRTNKPNPIVLFTEADEEGYAKTKHYVLFRDDWQRKLNTAKAHPFAIINGLTYYGNRNILSRSGQIYALMIDLDGVDENRLKAFLGTMFFSEETYPMPNIIGLSGNNIHLVYLLEHPYNLTDKMRKWLKWLKYSLIVTVWNKYTSSIDKIQFGSINQGFRILSGARTKINGIHTKCFRVRGNAKWELFGKGSLSEYITPTIESIVKKHIEKPELPEAAGSDLDGKRRVSWSEAKELWPSWAEEIEKAKEEGRPRQLGGYKVNRNLYDYWKKQIILSVIVGVRYWRMWGCAVIARKCDLPFEELKKDADELQKLFNLVGGPLFPFTENDEKDALKGYYDEKAKRYTYRLLCNYAGIPYEPKPKKPTPYKESYYLQKEMEALRNGEEYTREKFTREESFNLFAKEKGHLMLKKKQKEDPDFFKNIHQNRKTYAVEIKAWMEKHPYGTKRQCAEELGLARQTIYNHWSKLGGLDNVKAIVIQYRKDNPDKKVKDCMKTTGFSEITVRRYWHKCDDKTSSDK